MTTPAEAGRRAESAIELLEKALEMLAIEQQVGTTATANWALGLIGQRVSQALELLRNAEDDGK